MRTMYTAGKSAQVVRVMKQMKIHIMGISECRWTGAGRMKLSSGETVLYSGRDNDQHMQGVAIMMNQEKTDKLAHEAGRVGLKVNVDKCKLLRINSRNNDMVEVNGQGIEDVDRFVYLGATVSKEGGGTEDIHNRVVKARGVFMRLKKIWSSYSISRRTKVRLYKTLVKPVLMYGCETWKMNVMKRKSMSSKADVLGGYLRYAGKKRITNKEVLKMAEIENLSEDVRRRRWKFIGHIMRKELQNDCRTALTWAPEGPQKQGRPRTTWRRTAEREGKKQDGRIGVRYKWHGLQRWLAGLC